MTSGDVERIAQYTRLQDFHDLADTTKWEGDPADPLFSSVLNRPDCSVLRRTEHGCFFLSKSGCGLPVDVRPVICRLYPMDYRESGLTGLIDPAYSYCPVPTTQALLTELEMADEQQLRAWHRLLYQELRVDYAKVRGLPWSAAEPKPLGRIQAA